MKLYFSPGACSLASHIALTETGLPHQLEKVDLGKKTFSGGDFRKINPKGSVPCLQLDNGQVLTEGAVILQYIADQQPEAQLMAKAGTWERYRVQEWLNFVASDIHKGFSVLFSADRWVGNKEGNEQLKSSAKEALGVRLNYVNDQLAQKSSVTGDSFTVADAYLFTCLRWSPRVGIDLNKWPSIAQFMSRVEARSKVQATLKAESIVK